MTFTGCKVFSATRSGDRETLGERFTAWLTAHPEIEVVETRVLQSSDNAFHCFTLVTFTKEKP